MCRLSGSISLIRRGKWTHEESGGGMLEPAFARVSDIALVCTVAVWVLLALLGSRLHRKQ